MVFSVSPWLSLNCLPKAEIEDVCHHTWLPHIFFWDISYWTWSILPFQLDGLTSQSLGSPHLCLLCRDCRNSLPCPAPNPGSHDTAAISQCPSSNSLNRVNCHLLSFSQSKILNMSSRKLPLTSKTISIYLWIYRTTNGPKQQPTIYKVLIYMSVQGPFLLISPTGSFLRMCHLFTGFLVWVDMKKPLSSQWIHQHGTQKYRIKGLGTQYNGLSGITCMRWGQIQSEHYLGRCCWQSWVNVNAGLLLLLFLNGFSQCNPGRFKLVILLPQILQCQDSPCPACWIVKLRSGI